MCEGNGERELGDRVRVILRVRVTGGVERGRGRLTVTEGEWLEWESEGNRDSKVSERARSRDWESA